MFSLLDSGIIKHQDSDQNNADSFLKVKISLIHT